jgi:hypothetical protein
MLLPQNVPNVLKHLRLSNTGGWEGTEIVVIIAGNWATYKVCVQLQSPQMLPRVST